MRDGGDDGPLLPPAPASTRIDDGVLDTPNCPSCLNRMEAAESRGGAPYWSCPACGQAVLA